MTSRTTEQSTVAEQQPSSENKNDTKDIFAKSGAKFQIFVQLASIYLATTVTWEFMMTIFSGEGAGWKCTNNSKDTFCLKNRNVTFTNAHKDYDKRCGMNSSDWQYNVHKTYSFVTEFDLICERTSMAALISSAYYIGGFFGSLIAGIMSDNYGRKPVLLVTIIGMAASAVGGSFATNPVMLVLLNIVVGAFSVGCFVTVYVFQLEYVTPRFRAASGALMQMSVTISGCFLDLISYYVRYWRQLKIITALPCMLALIAILIAPESPRWLMSSGKVEKAKRAMKKICRYNKKSFDDIELTQPTQQQGKKGDKKYTYLHLVSNQKVFLITISAGVVWFTVALVAYGLMMESANIGGSVYQAFILSALGNAPAYLLAPYTSNRFGRKKSTLLFLTGAGILVGCMALVPEQSEYSYYIDLGIMIVSNCLIGTTFTLLYTWTFEIFPTQIRSQGMSMCVIFERLGVILVPFITRVLQQASHILPFLIMCALAICSALVGLKLPETNNRPLREKYEEMFMDQIDAPSNSNAYSFDNKVDILTTERGTENHQNDV